jgi:hypothetical protein
MAVTINGLSSHLLEVYLGHVTWFATGEGMTYHTKLLYDKQATSMAEQGNFIMPPTLICAVVQKEIMGQTYLDWNPEFKAVFFEQFGVAAWMAFQNAVVESKSYLELECKVHYNLS